MALNSKFLYFYKYLKVFSQSRERSWFSRLAYQFPRLGGGASLRQRRSRDRRRRRRHAQRERSLRKRTTASFGYLPSTLRIWRFVPPGVSHFRKARSAFARESIGFLSFLRLHVGFFGIVYWLWPYLMRLLLFWTLMMLSMLPHVTLKSAFILLLSVSFEETRLRNSENQPLNSFLFFVFL